MIMKKDLRKAFNQFLQEADSNEPIMKFLEGNSYGCSDAVIAQLESIITNTTKEA